MPSRASGTPAVGRALRVLELLATDEALRMSEIAVRLGLAKSTVHHVLGSLENAGWITKDPAASTYSLGIRAWEVGQAYTWARTLSQRAQPFLDSVRAATGETVRLAVLSGRDNVCVAKSVGSHRLVFDQRVGARLPAHATGLGKALLTGLSDGQIRSLYKPGELEMFTEHTITTVERLLEELSTIRAEGFAEDAGEYILGIRCVAVPVRRRAGPVVAAISVSVPSARFTQQSRDSTLEHLLQAADGLSKELTGEVELR